MLIFAASAHADFKKYLNKYDVIHIDIQWFLANSKIQEKYINFLRGMFKGTEPTKYIQLAYLTGILPIKI